MIPENIRQKIKEKPKCQIQDNAVVPCGALDVALNPDEGKRLGLHQPTLFSFDDHGTRMTKPIRLRSGGYLKKNGFNLGIIINHCPFCGSDIAIA